MSCLLWERETGTVSAYELSPWVSNYPTVWNLVQVGFAPFLWVTKARLRDL